VGHAFLSEILTQEGLVSLARIASAYSAISFDPAMKVFTAVQMRACDARATAEFKVPSLTLMENAGAALPARPVGHTLLTYRL